MKITQTLQKEQYQAIYTLLFQTPRICVKDISSVLGVTRKTAKKRMKEAFEQMYITKPDIKKRSYANFKEYVYFVKSKDSELLYMKYREDDNITYHARLMGAYNLWIISKEKLDIAGDIIVGGLRSDHYVAYAPHHSWETAIRIIQERIRNFDPEEYRQRRIIKTHWDQLVKWDAEDEALYRYFKYNLRKPFSPVMKKHRISGGKLYNWFQRLPQTCTISTHYYPETLAAYDPYISMFETDYEDFLIELFSEFPTTSSFFKVSDKLFVLSYVPKQYTRTADPATPLEKLLIPLQMIELLKKGIIKNKARAIVEYSKGKNI